MCLYVSLCGTYEIKIVDHDEDDVKNVLKCGQ